MASADRVACRWRVRARRAAARPRVRRRRAVGAPVRHQRRRRRGRARRQDAVPRERRRRGAGRVLANGSLDAQHRPDRGERGRARGRRRRHAGRRAPQPRPRGRAAGHRADGSTTSATASTSCCAAPSTRASPPWSSGCSPRTARQVDVSFCPERIAEGKAMEELRTLPQIVSGRTPEAVERAAELFGYAHRADRPARGGGGRAGQALHQHLALHQVRGGQPALHDRQRLRRRLRAHPRRDDAGLPAGRRHARARAWPPARACSRTRCSWPRSTTTTSRSATPA